ncbi:MAG: DUF934 domain-containing protein [Gammaproteobacteria bacterium]|nr:DUF934 domain-containing protein [Gammaproteobacteria bacterium]
MKQIIKQRRIVDDHWTLVAPETEISSLPSGDIIVPLRLWQTHRSTLEQRSGKLGVCLTGDDDLEAIAAEVTRFPVIALSFPVFRDGRVYSFARQLRQQYGYRGEIRAVGEVLRDQLLYMERVGFDAFEVHPRQNIESALAAFDELTVKYQASSDEPRPLYQRY